MVRFASRTSILGHIKLTTKKKKKKRIEAERTIRTRLIQRKRKFEKVIRMKV